MNRSRRPKWALKKPGTGNPGGSTSSTVTVMLVSAWLLGVTECAPLTLAGQGCPGRAEVENSAAMPLDGAPDTKDVPQSTAADAAPRPAKTKQDREQEAPAPKGEWLIAPIPLSSPAIGTGLEWAVARVFPLSMEDRNSPTSAVGVGGLFTDNGSRAFAFGGLLHLDRDRYRLTAAAGHASVNADVYGIGKDAGDRGVFLPLEGSGSGLLAQFLFRLKRNVYLGPRSQFRNLDISLDRDKLDFPDNGLDPPEKIKDLIDQLRADFLEQRTVSIGPRLEWDTRDSSYYPKRGFLLDYYTDFFATGLGSEYTYQYTKFDFNKYNSLGEHQVIAFRGMGCTATGDHVPIYDLCLFGSSSDVRGYSAGRYQDRRMFAFQGEYRVSLPVKGFLGRFGAVGFAGFGAVSPEFSDIGFSDLLPGGGGGIRFRLTKENPINFRVDLGFGKVGHTLSMGISEAF